MSSQRTTRIETKNFDRGADERRDFDKGKLEIANIGEETIARFRLEPGWKWSTSVKPLVNTPSCMQKHTGYVISGKMRVKMDDGQETEIGPGDAMVIPPGHDAWIIGNESFVGIDFTGARTYAKK